MYNAYTSYTHTTPVDGDNMIWPSNTGCTAMFQCDNDEAYAKGMSGAQIISAFEYMYANDGVKICGSAYLSNGCHVSADGCPNCKDVNT